jgi:hypothetical protein
MVKAKSTGATGMDVDRDTLNSRWQAIEKRLHQIDAASGLDQELCRAEVERLLTEHDQIEHVLGFDPSADPDSRRWSGMV